MLAVQPLHVMVRHCVGCVAGLHAIVARQSCFVPLEALVFEPLRSLVSYFPDVKYSIQSAGPDGKSLPQHNRGPIEGLPETPRYHRAVMFEVFHGGSHGAPIRESLGLLYT